MGILAGASIAGGILGGVVAGGVLLKKWMQGRCQVSVHGSFGRRCQHRDREGDSTGSKQERSQDCDAV